MMHGTPRILIVRLSAIGDVVRVLPAAQCLRAAFPIAQIDWVVESKAAAVVEGHPAIDQIWTFDRVPGWSGVRNFLELRRKLRIEQYDYALDFHGILKSGFLSWSTRAKKRVGFAKPRAQEGSHWFMNQRVALPPGCMNRVEENLALIAGIGVESEYQDTAMQIPEEVEEEVEEHLYALRDGGKALVAVHVAVDRPEKQWPVAYFSRLCDMLLADGRFDVLLTWGPGQEAVVTGVAEAMRRKPLIAPETPTLKHYAAMVRLADVYIGGDTGPMHIAASVGTPCVAIFGGTDPLRHRPWRTPSAVLYRGPEVMAGRPSLSEAEEYLRRVQPEDVYDACIRLLFPQDYAAVARAYWDSKHAAEAEGDGEE
ncbi:MAG: glycosyltransferase family 9 protein [Candidatus Hydrogenedentes bacterium]|nr:glycosyltransferase family 9 protein [Candidatus Hydrogenedentota bacterium]